jgi:hypothetical protein
MDKRQQLEAEYERKSDAWRQNDHEPRHDEEARLSPDDHKIEMQEAKAEMRHLLGAHIQDPDKRMAAAVIASRGRPVSSRILSEEIATEARGRKAAMYAAAAGLSGFSR